MLRNHAARWAPCRFLAGSLLASAALGIAYRYLIDPLDSGHSPNYFRSALHAVGLAFSGWAVHLAFAAVPHSRLGGTLRRLPLAAEFAVKAIAMTSVLTAVAVVLEFALYPASPGREWFVDDLPRIVGIAFAVSLLVGALFELRRPIGGRVLGSFLLGTYRRPKREERIVMFLDLRSSTALAERMGEVRVHDLITQFFFDIDQPIIEHGGEVHAYVGDAVIITWPLSGDPEKNARALRCFCAAEDKLGRLMPVYTAEFGVAPRFCAGLHAGPVVVSECGDAKRQIAYFGDTMMSPPGCAINARRSKRQCWSRPTCCALPRFRADWPSGLVRTSRCAGGRHRSKRTRCAAAARPARARSARRACCGRRRGL